MVVRGVMYDRRFLFDLPIAKIGCHLVQSDFLPQAVFGHDLVELLELAKAGDVACEFGPSRTRDGEATSAGEGRVLT